MKCFPSLPLLLFILIFSGFARAAYDPTVGVWLSRDPIGERGGLNLYDYVGNNPIWAIDPLGLDIAVVISGYSGGYNPFGHAGAGVTGQGAYTFGTSEKDGSNFNTYLNDRTGYGNNYVYVVKTTPAQDAAFIKAFEAQKAKGYNEASNTCATAVSAGLNAAGVTKGAPALIPDELQYQMVDLYENGNATRSVLPYKSTVNPATFSSFNPPAHP